MWSVLLWPCFVQSLEGTVADLVWVWWVIGLPSVCMSHRLSHSSQEKAYYERQIRDYEQVSDECSGGVVRVVHEAHPIPGVCSLCAEDS